MNSSQHLWEHETPTARLEGYASSLYLDDRLCSFESKYSLVPVLIDFSYKGFIIVPSTGNQ